LDFLSGDDYTIEKIYTGEALFLKFWYLQHPPFYKVSAIPGWKEGITGSLTGGYNVGICKHIDEHRRKAAAEVVKFITSKEVQKKYVLQRYIYSAINSLYDDEEVCSIIECDIAKNVKPFKTLDLENKNIDWDYYNEKYYSYFSEYIFGNKTISEVIKNVDDMTRFYSLSLKTEDTYVGLIVFIIFVVLFIIISLSIVFLFIKRFKSNLKFLSNDLWFILIIGVLILMCSFILLYGNLSVIKCHLKAFLISFGFITSLIPNIYEFIIEFPEDNKLSIWTKNNKIKFILIFLAIDIVLNCLLIISPYKLKDIYLIDSENFQKCIISTTFGKIIQNLIMSYEIIIILIILVLVFMEWNLEKIYYDTRFILGAVFMDILSLIIYNITNKIEINNYIAYNIIFVSNTFILSTSNFIFMYCSRVLISFIRNEDAELNESFIKRNQINNSVMKRSTLSTHTYNSSSHNSSNKENINTAKRRASELSNKILSYHYKVSKS